MGTNTLTEFPTGALQASDLNQFTTALNGDIVPRGDDGAPLDEGANSGSPDIPWGPIHTSSIAIASSALDLAAVIGNRNKVLASAVRSMSDFPAFLQPAGVGNGLSATIIASVTDPLIVNINGSTYSLTSNINITGLTAGFSSNHTALATYTVGGTFGTRTHGEPFGEAETIAIGTIGSEISSRVGTYQSFLLGTELFHCRVETAVLSKCWRGAFFDENLDPIHRATYSSGATITLLRTGWVFIASDMATTYVTYNTPKWTASTPGSPATGDFWYDLPNQEWKRYNGSAFVSINCCLLGIVANDDTDCIGARPADIFFRASDENTCRVELVDTTKVRLKDIFSRCSVNGNLYDYKYHLPAIDITADLAAASESINATEQASTRYFVYQKDKGGLVLSDCPPYVRPDLRGLYHPFTYWRCIGWAYNDGSSNLVAAGSFIEETGLAEINYIRGFNSTTDGLSTTKKQLTLSAQSRHASSGQAIVLGTNAFRFNRRGFVRAWLGFGLETGGVLSVTATLETASGGLIIASQVYSTEAGATRYNYYSFLVEREIRYIEEEYRFTLTLASGTCDCVSKQHYVRLLDGAHL